MFPLTRKAENPTVLSVSRKCVAASFFQHQWDQETHIPACMFELLSIPRFKLWSELRLLPWTAIFFKLFDIKNIKTVAVWDGFRFVFSVSSGRWFKQRKCHFYAVFIGKISCAQKFRIKTQGLAPGLILSMWELCWNPYGSQRYSAPLHIGLCAHWDL